MGQKHVKKILFVKTCKRYYLQRTCLVVNPGGKVAKKSFAKHLFANSGMRNTTSYVLTNTYGTGPKPKPAKVTTHLVAFTYVKMLTRKLYIFL